MSYAAQQQQRHQLLGAMGGLVQELQTLAPHPSQPNYTGPLFLANNSYFKPANDQDGMLGAMMMETMLGDAFAAAVSDAVGDEDNMIGQLDLSNALELYSEYITDIEGSNQHKAAHGQGTLARMSGKSISGSFNVRSDISPAMQAFLDDLPKRMTLERTMSAYARELALLDSPQPHYSAPQPRFAA